MRNKKIAYIPIFILFLIVVPLLVFAYSQNEENSIENYEDYIERILYVRCDVHGEVVMPLLFPPNMPMFHIYPSKSDGELFKNMDDSEQISVLRERLSKEAELQGFYVGPYNGDNVVNICYLCATEEGRDVVKTFHDVMALGN